MSAIPHTVTLKSKQHVGRRVPPRALGEILRELPVVVERSIRMAFVGRSTAKGKRNTWLESASDIRFVDHSGDDETILRFEAPPLGEAAESLYQQKELWPSKPAPGDTGFDLLCDVVSDVTAGNQDSDKFDSWLLKGLARFERGLDRVFQEIQISGHRYSLDQPAIVAQPTIERAKEFYNRTPSPQPARVVGKLDMIRASTQSFGLKLDDGEEVRGVLVEGDIEQLADSFGKRVLVLGRSVFRPSGRLLRLDAELVELAGEESTIWSKMPTPGMGRLNLNNLRQPQGPRNGVRAVIGHWPGDETDEEIVEALERLS